jgi:hypothetical protein
MPDIYLTIIILVPILGFETTFILQVVYYIAAVLVTGCSKLKNHFILFI